MRSPNAGGVPLAAPPGLTLEGEIGPHGAGRTRREATLTTYLINITCTVCGAHLAISLDEDGRRTLNRFLADHEKTHRHTKALARKERSHA